MPKTKPNVFDDQDITANEFLKTHWQRMPYLFSNTSVDLNCLPDIEELFKLAAQDDVQSRIVFSEDDIRFQAIYDDPEAWEEVAHLKPTLLVSDIEKWYPNSMRIMDYFPFIKNWRFDDLMMSYAPKGASVGAHTDHYDVFLIQVKGTRLWSFDNQPLSEYEMVEDSELSVIASYQAEQSFELKPGDVLYLPPEIPHHGISTSDDCVTCSIGLRAPSSAELMTAVTELVSQDLSAHDRFKDDVTELNNDASIGNHEIAYLRQQLQKLSQLSDEQLALYFGQYVTGYRLLDEQQHEPIEISQLPENIWLEKSPFAVFAYHLPSSLQANLLVNGELFNTDIKTAKTICNQNNFQLSTLKDKKLTIQLIELNAIVPVSE